MFFRTSLDPDAIVSGARPHVLALNLLAGVLSETSPRNARAVAQEALRLSQRLGDKDLEVGTGVGWGILAPGSDNWWRKS
jgi:hypothetical protein